MLIEHNASSPRRPHAIPGIRTLDNGSWVHIVEGAFNAYTNTPIDVGFGKQTL